MIAILKLVYRILLKGLAVVIPVLVTGYIIIWLVTSLESFCRILIGLVLPDRYYLPGLGFVVGIVVVGLIGLLFHIGLFRKTWTLIEKAIYRIPMIKTIYGAVKDFMDFMNRSSSEQAKTVVSLQLPGTSMKLIGFVTREEFHGLPEGVGGPDMIAVYLPMSYQIGGFTVILPRDAVQRIDFSIEDAMRFVLTGAMAVERENTEDPASTRNSNGRTSEPE